ncbi:pilus assembly protein PilX [Caproiciproducens sp. NJN-50]|uniref:pilus assembly protein PilX n=1 Tax=Acutalibacteraceae TaxID=3082771 RepID=UPI000FFE1A10|nr:MULTISPECIES: pilus assembly protein PilX [Acutalibacteraceae]QAT49941.1 pilus assembly protein PilX [Caproiciproducens sp. NJN-50]
MRRINTILSGVILVVFLTHGVMGSFLLLGIGSDAATTLAWVGFGLILIHAGLGVALTVQAARGGGEFGRWYLRQNATFWTRRFSGVAILILLFFHFGAYGETVNGAFGLKEFTMIKLVTQLLLIAALFIHVFVNLRPLLISLGVIKQWERRVDLFLIASVFLLFFTGAVLFYYIGWQYL